MRGAGFRPRPSLPILPRVLIPFRKMHGLGNDFVVVDGRHGALPLSPARIAAIADRHRGIGCDQFITLEPAAAGADVFMRIHNPDGSEAGACGNATRCVASLLMAETGRDAVTVRTVSGELPGERLPGGRIRVDMGHPRFGWEDVPLAEAMDTAHLPLALGPVADPAACSMGNPHATFFVDDLDALDWRALGPQLEQHPLFPDRANIGFAQVVAPDHLRVAIWERGAGPTLACGSGACATLVNAHRRGLAIRRARVELPGGVLELEWRLDGAVLMTGPVATAFLGQIDPDSFPA
ncbi:diaminopimelate epimerase [Teichococcus vastitatis]|uniref:Diaminopimelate epimerase n=1 Tax=Teichococcus vastitatis TaxID=2307076 RepID=A0ABS9W5U8_9PROT|nr:diaminopimelate epimerase [Pseudoroseomonas vastitatis]MCI0754662.1 diaminopimelate epimerase [Pseudoroseomonas vastitatis]